MAEPCNKARRLSSASAASSGVLPSTERAFKTGPAIITSKSGNQNSAMPGARKFLTPGSTLYHNLNSGE